MQEPIATLYLKVLSPERWLISFCSASRQKYKKEAACNPIPEVEARIALQVEALRVQSLHGQELLHLFVPGVIKIEIWKT